MPLADAVFSDRAAALDRHDPLARYRAEFYLPPGRIYLDGNSLGLLSRPAEASLLRAIDQWRTLGIEGWTEAASPWITLADTAAAVVAPLVGAAPEEICVTGQTTANLHQLLATLYDPSRATARILIGDTINFASDTYALQSHLRLRGLDPAQHLRLIKSRDGRTLHRDDILAAFTPDVQMVVLPAVVFSSGQLLDVGTITRCARERGLCIGWDLSHSIGAVPHDLHRDGVDFAFWCHYKWLNAGPGAIGGLYLNRRHFLRSPGLAGWWGVRPDRRFAMSAEHEPADGAQSLHVGTPPILSLAPLLGSLYQIAEAGGIEALRAKSLALTDLLLSQIDRELTPFGFSVATPRDPRARGGHVAICHPQAWKICQAWKSAGVIPDFRAPDLVRIAPSPLYTRYRDCVEALERLVRIMIDQSYQKEPSESSLVP